MSKELTLALAGAGEMGTATLGVLARRLPEACIRVIDRSAEHLARAQAVAPEQITTEQVEIDYEDPPSLEGVDLAINFAGPFYVGSNALARAALLAGCPYMDICDDVEGTRAVLELDDAAVAAGTPLISGAGNSPGISNVMGKRLLEEYPAADGIRVVWVVRDSDPGGLAPLRHMLHMAVEPCPLWDGGEMVNSPGFVPRTAREHDLPEPVGRITAFDTAHPEPITMSRAFPSLRHVSVQGALLPGWANDAFSTLGRIGFGDHDLKVEVDGVTIAPDVVLWKLLWARHHKRGGVDGSEKAGLTCVQVQALEGEKILGTLSIYDNHSMSRTTALGAAAAALAVLDSRPPPGSWGTEVLDAKRTLDFLIELAEQEQALPAGLIHNGVPSFAG